MFQFQMLAQKAYILALHYVSAGHSQRTPEEFLAEVQKMEKIFLRLLQADRNR